MQLTDLASDPIVATNAIVRASNGLIAAVAADGKAAGFPPLEWYDVLWELERRSRGLRPYELEHGLLIAQYNVSRLVERMCQAGYVERRPCASDARGQVLVITDKGRRYGRKCGRSIWHPSSGISVPICRPTRRGAVCAAGACRQEQGDGDSNC
jgi:DNA-binding MarR family transcriptional regulator